MDTGSLEYNVIVVKWGNKFTAEHVNRLYRMAKRNLTLPFNFYCYTEDQTNIYDEVNIIPLDESLDLEKWWWKLTLFKENNLKGINLYLDLDVVIQKNIDHLFQKVKQNKLTLISNNDDWVDPLLEYDPKTISEYNSSIMLWNSNQLTDIYQKFISNKDFYCRFYHGIDRFFTYEIDQNNFNDIGEEEYYFRRGLISYDGKKDFKEQNVEIRIKNGRKVQTVFFNKNIPICVFNGFHEEYFYQGMEKYLV